MSPNPLHVTAGAISIFMVSQPYQSVGMRGKTAGERTTALRLLTRMQQQQQQPGVSSTVYRNRTMPASVSYDCKSACRAPAAAAAAIAAPNANVIMLAKNLFYNPSPNFSCRHCKDKVSISRPKMTNQKKTRA